MTSGTIAVVVVLALIVGAIIYRWIKARKAGINPHCSGCSGCSGSCGCSARTTNSDDATCGSLPSELEPELLNKHHDTNGRKKYGKNRSHGSLWQPVNEPGAQLCSWDGANHDRNTIDPLNMPQKSM